MLKKVLSVFFLIVILINVVACDSLTTDSDYYNDVSNTESTVSTDYTSSTESTVSTDDTSSIIQEANNSQESESKPVIEENSVPSNTQSTTVTVPEKEETIGNLVWVPTHGGKKYHSKSSCSGMKEPMQVTKETAETNGFTPCARCY